MKNLTKFVSSVLVIGTLTTGGITSFAATEIAVDASDKMSSNTIISEEAPNISSMKRSKHGLSIMEKPELTDEQKAEMAVNIKEKLAAQLNDGNISQEQYDQALTDISEGKRPSILREGKRGFNNKEKPELTDEQKAEMAVNIKEKLAAQLNDGNITQEQYDQALTDISEGKRPSILREGKRDFNNKEKPELTDEQKSEMTVNMKERLVAQLNDGNITQEQYDQALTDISEGKRPNILREGKRGLNNKEKPELTD